MIFTGVVESLFSVVKSCILAVEKQWFDDLEGLANVHAHLPLFLFFVFRVLQHVLLVSVASLENDSRCGKTRVCDPMPA